MSPPEGIIHTVHMNKDEAMLSLSTGTTRQPLEKLAKRAGSEAGPTRTQRTVAVRLVSYPGRPYVLSAKKGLCRTP